MRAHELAVKAVAPLCADCSGRGRYSYDDGIGGVIVDPCSLCGGNGRNDREGERIIAALVTNVDTRTELVTTLAPLFVGVSHNQDDGMWIAERAVDAALGAMGG